LKTTVNKISTLLEFLTELYPDSPRTRIKKLLRSGTVNINNKPVTLHSFLLKPGDIVETIPQSVKASKAGVPFPVLYEDNHIIVVDKPAGKPTSSTDGSLSIYEIISEYLQKQSKGKERAFVVHRLDKEVSGVLLFAKSHDAMETIKEDWVKTEKHYYALVEGLPEKSEDTIKSWLIEDNVQKVHSTGETANARFSITSYKIIKRLANYSLLDVHTDTGRKNQIRVHLSDIGCPIVGDRKYGASADFIRRIRLHAYSLSFPHPESGEMMTVLSQMPDGFLSLKAKNENYK